MPYIEKKSLTVQLQNMVGSCLNQHGSYNGNCHHQHYFIITVADIPGLIEDAHKNRGLGLSFLKHIEQCVCLLYVIDLSIDEPWTQLESLKFELEQFTPGLSQRPHAIIGNKMDLENARDNFLQLQKHTCLPVIPVSAKKRQNVQQLLVHLRKLYDINNGKLLQLRMILNVALFVILPQVYTLQYFPIILDRITIFTV